MALSINQFQQSVVKGQVDLRVNPSVIEVQNKASGADLVPGDMVILVATSSGIPQVEKVDAATDNVFGVVLYDLKKSTFVAGDMLTVAFGRGSVVYLEASEAIDAYEPVMWAASQKVAVAATAGNYPIGYALDAGANAALIRCVIDLPGIVIPTPPGP